MDIELRHLRYFVAVAEGLHFGHAAERLRIAQPSLSQQIRKLENEVGFELFSRAHRRVELTPAGEALLPRAIRILDDTETALRTTREAARGITGHLTLGFIEAAAITIVPEAVRRFRTSFPKVGLTLRELGVREQIEGIQSGRLDVGFIRSEPQVEGLVTEPVLEEELLVAVPSGHRYAGRQSVGVSEIASEQLIAVEREILPELYDQTVSMLQQHQGGGYIAQKASSLLTVLGLVSTGLGLAVLPTSIRGLNFTGMSLVAIENSPSAVMLAVYSGGPRSPYLEAFLQQIRDDQTSLRKSTAN